jgi:hypothetical protein
MQIKLGWSFGSLLNEFGEVYIWGNIFLDYKKALNLNDNKIPLNIFHKKEKDNIDKIKFVDINCGFSHLLLIGIKDKYNNIDKDNNSNNNNNHYSLEKILYSFGSNEFVNFIYFT